MSKHEFEELSIPRWKITANEVANKVYRVFKEDGEFDEIEADSANEAMQKAGVEDAFMIKQGKADHRNVFDQSMLAADEVAEAAMANAQEPVEEASEGEESEVAEDAPVDAMPAEEAPQPTA